MEQSLRVQVPPRPPISERFRLDSAIQLLILSPMLRFAKVMPLLLAAGFATAPLTLAAGLENFNNFPETGSGYNNGTFTGQDGSTWTYFQCRGNKVIDAPTPGLNDEDPLAYIVSGTLTGGCGTLSFDYKQLFTHTSDVDVVVNDTVRYTVHTQVQNATNHSGDLAINVGGNFTLKFIQNNNQSGQVAIDNVFWTSYGGAAPEPPALLFSPNSNSVITAYSNAVNLTVTATEPNTDSVHLWAAGLPIGATFVGATGATPLISAFAWTPTSAQTGTYSVVFYAGDKDGTNSRTFSIEVTPIYPYYHYAEGLTGAVLKAKLHDIISEDYIQLTADGPNNELDPAMADIHTDPDNTNNVRLLYNPGASLPKTTYNKSGGWNKEHCWLNSHGLGDGPDGVDLHNLYAEYIAVNSLRNDLIFDESDPSDPEYVPSAHSNAPDCSMDSDSWEPPLASKGNVARANFYMATRYNGSEPNTTVLELSNTPNTTNQMGILRTLLLWNAMDAPDEWERTRNELIYTNYQHNRNPFVDHPEWAESIWGTDSDSDGINDTYEIIAGTATNNLNSRFEASFEATLAGTQVVCSLLSSGSVWRLYEGTLAGQNIAWRQIAETNRLEAGTLRFNVAPTNPATFYHLRAYRP